MYRTLAVILVLITAFSALSESVLTVNGTSLSYDEVACYASSVAEEYSEIAQYYKEYLGVDYWKLEYAGGVTVEESIKADAFKNLVLMLIFYDKALDTGLTLSETDLIRCAQNAHGGPGSAEESLNRKQLLANRMYYLMLSEVSIDTAAYTALIDPDEYREYEVEYLYLRELPKELELLLSSGMELSAIAERSSGAGCGSFTLEAANDDVLTQAAAQLEVGETSQPILTEFGWFVLKLTDCSGTAAYEAAVADTLYKARQEAFAPEYEAMYKAAEYTITDSFKDALTINGGEQK